MNTTLNLRVTVVRPVPGAALRVQQGRADLLPPSHQTAAEVSFDFTVRVGERPSGEPNFLGEFAQGPAAGRFIYVNSGARAGQADSPWDRRAKVPFGAITWEKIKAATAKPGRILETRIAGRDEDGGPACGTVPLLGSGWRVVPPAGD